MHVGRQARRSDENPPAADGRGFRPVTEFQKRVYDALGAVAAGRVTTYGDLARSMGCGSARAVGQALRRNPFAPGVPCHRVIAADLSIGGFQGQSGGAAVRRKVRRLAREGVLFAGGRLVDRARLLERNRDIRSHGGKEIDTAQART